MLTRRIYIASFSGVINDKKCFSFLIIIMLPSIAITCIYTSIFAEYTKTNRVRPCYAHVYRAYPLPWNY